MVRRLSSISTLRSSAPTSPDVARNFMNFRFNHITQRKTMPAGCVGAAKDAGMTMRGHNDHLGPAGPVIGEAFGTGGYPWTDTGTIEGE
jgi:hypothetical protein